MLESKNKVVEATTWQNFKRLIGYAKPYKAGFVVAILGMLGYAGIDTLFFSQLQPLIDDGLTDANPKLYEVGAAVCNCLFYYSWYLSLFW